MRRVCKRQHVPSGSLLVTSNILSSYPGIITEVFMALGYLNKQTSALTVDSLLAIISENKETGTILLLYVFCNGELFPLLRYTNDIFYFYMYEIFHFLLRKDKYISMFNMLKLIFE